MSGALTMMLGGGRKTPVALINAIGGTNITSLTVPTHQNGDVILLMNGNRDSLVPATTSGFTSIITGSVDNGGTTSDRSYRLQFRISDGTITSLPVDYYGFVAILRNVGSLGAFNNYNVVASGANTIALPDLTGLNTSGSSIVIAGSYVTTTATSVSSPYILNTLGSGAGVGVLTENTNSSITGATITGSGNLVLLSWAVEFI